MQLHSISFSAEFPGGCQQGNCRVKNKEKCSVKLHLNKNVYFLKS
jgi:hypothetical protein